MRRLSLFLMTLACISWAIGVIVLSVILKTINPETLVILRWGLVLVFLAPVIYRLDGLALPPRRLLLPLAAMGVTSVVLGNLLSFEAYKTSTPTNIGFILALGPVIIGILSFALLGERFTPGMIVGALLAFGGVIVSMSKGRPDFVLNMRFVIGDLYITLSVISNAVYAILGKRLSGRINPTAMLFWGSLFGLVAFLPFGSGKFAIAAITPGLVFAVLYVSLVGSLLARWVLIRSMKHITATEAAMLQNTQPLITAALAALVLGDPFEWWHICGWIVMSVGLFLFYRRRKTIPPQNAPEL